MKFIIILLLLSQSLLIPGYGATVPPQLKLLITQTMPTIPSDGKPHPAFDISIVDSANKPKALPYSLNLTITSSDDRIIQVPKTATIKSTYYYTIINATSSALESKQAQITVSAPGFITAITLATVGPPAGTPRALKVTILPNTLLPPEIEESDVIVTLVDSYGNPTKARTDTSINLSSDNLKIADLTSKNIIISAGSISAKTKIITKGLEGSAFITATTLDLFSDKASITVAGSNPDRIYLFTPTIQQTQEWTELFIGILDSNSNPVSLITPMTITLYSSNTTVLTVTRTVTIGKGNWSALVEIKCLNPGQADISARAGEIESKTPLTVKVVPDLKKEPKYIKIYAFSQKYPADGNVYTALIVQALDDQLQPAKYWLNKEIDIISSNNLIFDTSINKTVKIMSGESTAVIFGMPLLGGKATIYASAQDVNVQSAYTEINCYAPSPTTIEIQAPPIPSDGEVEACILLTSNKIPVGVQEDTQFSLDSADKGVIECTDKPIITKKIIMLT